MGIEKRRSPADTIIEAAMVILIVTVILIESANRTACSKPDTGSPGSLFAHTAREALPRNHALSYKSVWGAPTVRAIIQSRVATTLRRDQRPRAGSSEG